jgi:tetratricopeptide (TPR) repeat protein
MAPAPPRTRLEQLSQAAHLSVREFVASYHKAALELGDNAHVSDRQTKRWLAGTSTLPRSAACRVLEHWWGEPVATLFGTPTLGAEPVPADPRATEDLLNAAAREASEHALSAAQTLDSSALEQLHAEARRAARAYFSAPPLALFADLIRLRALVRDQLDRTRKPRQEAELYLILGQVSGLLASVSTALGHLDAAEEQARAAHTYGRIIDHPSLCAWARALQVAAAFWSGRPRQAAEVAAVALEIAPAGTARARLYAVQARALALIGARGEASAAMRSAADQLDQAGADALLDEVGGELGFSHARTELCASSAHVSLGHGREAEQTATNALDLFAGLPAGDRWLAGELGAQIDLGAARTLRGDLAGAEAALAPVFTLDPDRRTEALSRRLVGLGRVLASRPYRGAQEAHRLGEQIEDFTTRSLGRTVRAIGPTGG